MIDGWGLFRNALWVMGLAGVVAVLSMASYQARVEGVRLWQKLGEPALQVPLSLGVALFCLGLLLGSRSWWEQAIWGLLTVLSSVQTIWLWRKRAGNRPR